MNNANVAEKQTLPSVDVIIPVYNGERYLEEAVRSAIFQTWPPQHIIIADDGSTDATAGIAQALANQFPSVKYVRLPHGGSAAARNGGLAASSSPFVAFLDADDVWYPSKLERQMEVFLRSDSHLGVVYANYENIDENGAILADLPVFRCAARGNIFNGILVGTCVIAGSSSAVVVRREFFDAVGGFDTNLYNGEDWEMWIRLASVCSFDYCEETLVKRRVHRHSKTGSKKMQTQLRRAISDVSIYNKWSHQVFDDPVSLRVSQKRILVMIFPYIYAFSSINRFYDDLNRIEEGLSRRIFGTRCNFWKILAETLLNYLKWKMVSILFGKRELFRG